MKITKQKQLIKIIGYMSKVEEIEVYMIESNYPIEMYINKNDKYKCIYEKETGARMTNYFKTQKEVLQNFDSLIEKFGIDRMMEIKENKLNKNGNINNYTTGEFVGTKKAI